MVAISNLLRIAREVPSDAAKFLALVDLEEIPDAEGFLSQLGHNPQEVSVRFKVLHPLDHVLDSQLDFLCATLSGREQGKGRRDMVVGGSAAGIPDRATLQVRDLIKLAIDAGIHLHSAPEVDVPGLRTEIKEAMLLLNRCGVPVPVPILANAVGSTPEVLNELLEHARGAVLVADGKWKLAPLPVPLPHASGDLCARGLKAILSFIDTNRYHDEGRQQVHNAVALARICASARPDAVARMFITIDKPLKAWGDKHLVLDAAELVIGCARRAPSRGRPEAQGKAQPLIFVHS